MFKLKQTGSERGDCTAPYDVILDKPYTVKEFISAVLTERSDEWGSIGIDNGHTIFGSPRMDYKKGVGEYEPLKNFFDKPVKSATASGGWTRMDYLLTV